MLLVWVCLLLLCKNSLNFRVCLWTDRFMSRDCVCLVFIYFCVGIYFFVCVVFFVVFIWVLVLLLWVLRMLYVSLLRFLLLWFLCTFIVWRGVVTVYCIIFVCECNVIVQFCDVGEMFDYYYNVKFTYVVIMWWNLSIKIVYTFLINMRIVIFITFIWRIMLVIIMVWVSLIVSNIEG